MTKPSFQFWDSYYYAVEECPREYQDALWGAIIRYIHTGKDPDFSWLPDKMGQTLMRAVWNGILPNVQQSKVKKGNTNAANDKELPTNCPPDAHETPTRCPRTAHPIEVEVEVEKEIENDSKTYLPSDFDFKSSLISLGVSEDVAAKFMTVRNSKGARNTLPEFNKIADEIKKANAGGVMANECIQMSIENQWQGFEYEWYQRKVKPIDERKTERHNEQEEEFFKMATEQHMLKAIAKRIRKGESDTYQLLDRFDASCSLEGVGHEDFEHFVRHFEKKVREGKVFTRVS